MIRRAGSVAPVAHLIAALEPRQVDEFIVRRLGDRPSLVKHMATVAALPMGGRETGPGAWFTVLPSNWTLGLIGATLTHGANRYGFEKRRRALTGLLGSFRLTRASIGLDDKEKAIARAMAALFARGLMTSEAWSRFAAELTWADGQAALEPAPELAGDPHLPEARQVLSDLLKATMEPHRAALAAAAAIIAREEASLPQAIRDLVRPGARWMTTADCVSAKLLSPAPSPAALIVGHDPATGQPLYYARPESLFTIGGPGTGKTECQVLPNLLSYKGSAIVLDVKGELWEKTAGWRQRNAGPVFRFAPTDPHGRTHRYNPFDFIGTEPETAATDCEVFSAQVIVPTPNHHDPYWENRGRDFLWAMAMIVALRSKGPSRAMATLMRLLSVPLDMKASDPAYPGSDTEKLVNGLHQLAAATNVRALAEHANAIRGGLGSQRLESVADNARRFLNIFSRSASLRAAMSASDWHPRMLRERPGTTVYLCLSGDDLDTFAPVVRLILQQHANALLRDFKHKPGEPPVTFFLDEFPQLKRMESLMRMVDTGRGAGLRLWFFAQYLGQVRQAYDKQADGLIGACRIKSFLSPDAEAAEYLKPYLGTRRNLFSGETTPLAETHELLGQAFADTILTLAGGPLKLAKRFAWETMADRILPPPVLRRQKF
ncbi:MAG: type IV secretory system conjugative DNA transfer family protein [Hyphomicrobiaceae bacterium]